MDASPYPSLRRPPAASFAPRPADARLRSDDMLSRPAAVPPLAPSAEPGSSLGLCLSSLSFALTPSALPQMARCAALLLTVVLSLAGTASALNAFGTGLREYSVVPVGITSSGVYSGGGGSLSNLVDGITLCETATTPNPYTIFYVAVAGNSAANSYFLLDLGTAYTVTRVEIWGRLVTGSTAQSNNLTVYVGTSSAGTPPGYTNFVCAYNVSPPTALLGSPLTLNCNTVGRYITILKPDNNYLSLCEVKVWVL